MNNPRGEKHHNSKLTSKEVKEIKKEWPQNSQTFLAKKFRVNPTTIHRVISGFTWKHCS